MKRDAFSTNILLHYTPLKNAATIVFFIRTTLQGTFYGLEIKSAIKEAILVVHKNGSLSFHYIRIYKTAACHGVIICKIVTINKVWIEENN